MLAFDPDGRAQHIEYIIHDAQIVEWIQHSLSCLQCCIVHHQTPLDFWTSDMASIFSFFSGSGFLDLGFEESGFQIEFMNEVHRPFAEAYTFSRQKLNMPQPTFGNYLGDIERLLNGDSQLLEDHIKEVRRRSDIVGFIGGPPCPDFSVGGKNRGKGGDKGILSAIYIALITKQKPDFFLFENVKGLWRTKKHRAFYEEMKTALSESGYCLTERVANAIEYGVPQDRDRIILLGFRRELLTDLGLYHALSTFDWDDGVQIKRDIALSYAWPGLDHFIEHSFTMPPQGIPVNLTVEYWFRRNRVDKHPNAEHHFRPRAGLPRFQTIAEGDDSRKSFKRLHRWRYSPTAAYGNNEVHLHPYYARRISAAEALAIQSMPEGFTLPDSMSLTNMFKTIGNGVPYLMAVAIAETLKTYLQLEKLTHASNSPGRQQLNPCDQFAAKKPDLSLPRPA